MNAPLKFVLAIGLSSGAVVLAGCATPEQRAYAVWASGDLAAATKMYLPLAQAGNAAAQNNVGLYYEFVVRNARIASQWYLLSAKQGLPDAMRNLGRLNFSVGKTQEAISWLTLAARMGDKQAMALLTERGYRVPGADLIAQQPAVVVQQQAAPSQATSDGMYALGCALAGGCSTPGTRAKPSAPQCKLSPYRKDSYGNPLVVCE